MTSVLILSWEYPPLIEGGLARHVRKLSEALVELDVDVHVLTRGGEESPEEEVVAGVSIHRVREPSRPTDLGEFVAWVERMNADMLAAGVELGDRYDFDLVHGHDWLVAMACDHLARRFGSPLVATIHATEHGRHQGWVDKHPQSHIHGVEQWIANRADRVIACSYYMREQIADIFGVDDARVAVIPNGIDPGDLQPQSEPELARLRLEFARPDEKLVLLIGRLVYEKGFQLALEAMPALIERLPRTRFLVAGSGTHEHELRRQAETLLTDDALRDRLVAEAREHVLRFDWAEVARDTTGVYERLVASRRPART
ncbi:MAG: glycosyltransferase family 4 protein [Solirubrobacterales bacterium]